MSPTVRVIFECGDLAAASPGTVSRCGVVLLEPEELGWRSLEASFVEGPLTERLAMAEQRELVTELMCWLVEPVMEHAAQQTAIMAVSRMHRYRVRCLSNLKGELSQKN